jgi:hypothetical protein
MSEPKIHYATEEGIDVVTFFPQGDWSQHGGTPDPIVKYYARPAIADLVEHYTGPNPSRRAVWTNFEHYKWSMAGIGSSGYLLPYVSAWPNTGDRYWLARFPTYFGWTQHSGSGGFMPSSLLYVPDGGPHIVPGPPNLVDLKRRALKSIMPGVRDEMSVLNSLYELKDFKGMLKSAVRNAKELKRLTWHLPPHYWAEQTLQALMRGWRAYIRDLKKKTRGQLATHIAGAAAENFLQWKFAIQPLISDIRAARRAVSSLEKKVNRLLSNEGKARVGHWSTGFKEASDASHDNSFNLGPPLNYPISVSAYLRRDACEVESSFHCEVRYNYNLTNYQREHARMLSLLDAFGLGFNPSIIWNAVKFTFLVDWIIDVSHFLDQFSVGNMDPKINVLGALWSVRKERVITWSKEHATDLPIQYTQRLSMPAIRETAYRRQLFNVGIDSLYESGLSSSEFTLGAALVTAIAARKARRK